MNKLDQALRDREPRPSRENTTRDVEQRFDTWKPTALLPEPDPRDGWVHRWIRSSLMGTADNMNVSVRFREGWEACLADDYPELQILTDRGTQFKTNIEVGGLLLCRAPEELIQKRKEYFDRAAQAQVDSVDNNFMRQNDPRMPLFSEKSSEVKFGRGK